ncbi:MAG: hypothetical protein MUE71_06430 [Chitinophagaceae bacterium]|nr:hypothetical protein [Chitinophagaceae bacterium]MCU0404924.1 hypothetical protein [Chitinophagaceae bacterium]
MKKNVFVIMVFLGLLAFTTSCKKDVDNPEEDSAHGAITTFSIKFSQAGTLKYEAVFDDPDGPGGAAPIRFDEIKLQKGQTYQASITLTNKSKTPAEDMTATVRTQGHQHLFYFSPTGLSGLNITLTDADRIGLPIGLESQWQTPATATTGTTRIGLRHIAAGKSASSGPTSGHSDMQIDFITKIE